MDCCRRGWVGRVGACIPCLPECQNFLVPPLSLALFCPPSHLPCTPAPPPAPAHACKEVCLSQGGWRSMILRRRALRCIRIRINWILLVVAGRSELSFYVLYSTFEGKKGSRQFTVLSVVIEVIRASSPGEYRAICSLIIACNQSNS